MYSLKTASEAFYESEEYLNLEKTNSNLGREKVFYTVWRKCTYLNLSFLRECVLGVIEGFKAKFAEEATPLIEIPNDEVLQIGEVVEEIMDKDEGMQ